MTSPHLHRRQFLMGVGAAAMATTLRAVDSAALSADQQAHLHLALQDLPDVPREETLIMSVSDTFNQFNDAEVHNPFLPVAAQRTGWHFSFEPLYFFNSQWNEDVTAPPGLTGERGEIPYQAESYAFNADYTELTVNLRDGITWSDGEPFTADDVVFTVNMLRDNAPDLNFSFDTANSVDDVVAVDPLTVKFTLSAPFPNFMAQYFMWVQDQGYPIVPKHIYGAQADLKTFTNHDLSAGWPVSTGPWQLVSSAPTQKIWDRRDDWWGAATGFHPLPAMRRVVVLPRVDDPGKTQLLSNGDVDMTHNLLPADVQVVLSRNPNIQVFTADNEAPYGAIDTFVNVLGFNNSNPPFDDVDIRRALNHALNRQQIIDVGFRGAGEFTVLPIPALPSMQPFFDSVQDILERHPVDDFDLAKTDEIMLSKGYTKDSDDFWEKDGERFSFIIQTSPGFFQNYLPVVVQQFREAGFDVSFTQPTNFTTVNAIGEVESFIVGVSGATRDPWINLRQYHSRYIVPSGEAALYPHRWSNPEFDAIIDEMSVIEPGGEQFMQLWHDAMEIWIPNLPSLPLVQAYQICPVNTQYWVGWPNQENPYTTPAGWHRGAAGLVINSLQPAER